MSADEPTYQIQYDHLEKQSKMLARIHQPESHLPENIELN